MTLSSLPFHLLLLLPHNPRLLYLAALEQGQAGAACLFSSGVETQRWRTGHKPQLTSQCGTLLKAGNIFQNLEMMAEQKGDHSFTHTELNSKQVQK